MARMTLKDRIDGLGTALVRAFQLVALFVIGGTIVWSAASDYLAMIRAGRAGLEDILLLFIYLELGAMVGIYFKTNHLPVRFLIYVALTALTRLLIADVQAHNRPEMGIVLVSGAILLLSLAALVIRYGSFRFPSGRSDRKEEAHREPRA